MIRRESHSEEKREEKIRKRLCKLFAVALCVAMLVSDMGIPDGMRGFAAESDIELHHPACAKVSIRL